MYFVSLVLNSMVFRSLTRVYLVGLIQSIQYEPSVFCSKNSRLQRQKYFQKYQIVLYEINTFETHFFYIIH